MGRVVGDLRSSFGYNVEFGCDGAKVGLLFFGQLARPKSVGMETVWAYTAVVGVADAGHQELDLLRSVDLGRHFE